MLQELLGIFLAFGIALSPTTSLLFRTLTTLEGTLTTLCPAWGARSRSWVSPAGAA
jgi:hypothetical protein